MAPLKKKKSPGGFESLQVIDLARSFSIMAVLALHLKPTLPLPPPAFRWGWDHFQRSGGYGVSLFFVISGFLITRVIAARQEGLFRPNLRWFYARRAGRILPLFLLTVLLGLALASFLPSDTPKFRYCFKLPDHPADLSFWIPLLGFAFNWAVGDWGKLGGHWTVFWTLAVEEQFYLFYPLALKKAATSRAIVAFLIFWVVAGLGWRLWVFTQGAAVPASSMRHSWGAFDQIALGALLFFTQQKFGNLFSKNKSLRVSAALTGLGIIVAVYFCTFPMEGSLDWVYGPTLISLGLCLFLMGAFYLPFFESRALRPFTWPGRYSYGNYLFHMSVIYFLNPLLWNLNIVVAYLIFVAVTTAVSALSYRFFEAPANRCVQRLGGLKKT
jgi:peptidoglycan/LPS O-acetylase OafA/YrhL